MVWVVGNSSLIASTFLMKCDDVGVERGKTDFGKRGNSYFETFWGNIIGLLVSVDRPLKICSHEFKLRLFGVVFCARQFLQLLGGGVERVDSWA